MKIILLNLPVFVFLLLILVIASPVKADTAIAENYGEFQKHLNTCAKQNGYDYQQTHQYQQYEIAPGELAFLDCAYQSVIDHIIPNSLAAEDYYKLINEHRQMTLAVKSRLITRNLREKKTQFMLEQIRAKEANILESRKREIDAMRSRLYEMERQMNIYNQISNKSVFNNIHNAFTGR